MTDRRVLIDNSAGTLARIVDGLHDVVKAFGDRRFAIVGGIAVLAHVPGHRVTQDIDSAARGVADEVREELLVVAALDTQGPADVLLPNGVPVDLLIAGDRPPRSSIGQGAQARRVEATGHAVRWAIDTAHMHEVVCEPVNSKGAVIVPIADVGALIVMKTIALTDPRRGEKAESDRLDLWRLLTDDIDRGVGALVQASEAPAPARRLAAEVLVNLFRDEPEELVRRTAGWAGGPDSVADVKDIWDAVVEAHINRLRR